MEGKKIMGYESKIYIIEKTKYSWDEENGMKYARVLAMFDLAMFDVSKFYELSDWFRNKPATKHYIYADDGDTQIIEDRYGDTLKEASVEDVIDRLERIVENGKDYKRIFPLLAALKAFESHSNQWGNIAVLHYGY